MCDKRVVLKLALFCLFGLVFLLLLGSRLGPGPLYRSSTGSKGELDLQSQKLKGAVLNGTVRSPQENTSTITQLQRGGTSQGYVLVTRYSDQMTGASLNILSLQCWAAAVGPYVRVVRPFLRRGSKFGFDLPPSKSRGSGDGGEANSVELGDLFDMESWEAQTDKLGYAPLIRWEDFLASAPRRLILVSKKCPDCTVDTDDKFHKSASAFARNHVFTIVRHARFEERHYTAREFKALVYGDNMPGNSVVIFNYWGGICGSSKPHAYRISISDLGTCNRKSFSSFLFRNSRRIREDSKNYVERYLPEVGKRGYVSVMFRSERFALGHDFHSISSEDEKRALFVECIKSIGKSVDDLKRHFGIKSVLLTMDCLSQGSSAFRRPEGPEYFSRELVQSVATMLYQKLYGNESPLEEWESSFDQVASLKSPGYLAQVQKNLAARGTCLLMAGGGGFQLSAEELYNATHRTGSVHCALRVPNC